MLNYFDHLLHFACVVDDVKCIVVTRVCVCVCLSVRGCTPTLLHGPGCNLGVVGDAPYCAVLDGFAIGARVSLLWQHSAKREMSASACTRSMPRLRFLLFFIFATFFISKMLEKWHTHIIKQQIKIAFSSVMRYA